MSKKFNKVSEIGVSPFSPTAFLPKAELLRFTKWFSENYKILSCGDYFSSHNNYHIKYVEKIIDTQTGARIARTSKTIEIDKSIFKNKEYTADFLFYIIILCVIMGDFKCIRSSDRLAVKYYLTTGRSNKNLKQGLIALFSDTPTELNIERYKLIEQMLN